MALRGRGAPPSLVNPPAGCRFNPRCPFAMDICRTSAPPALPVGDDQVAACWLHSPDHKPEAPVST